MSEAMHHDHGHSHGPPADDLQGYYTEQLLTIGTCGALAGVAILLYLSRGADGSGMLGLILVSGFHPWVLAGGLVLMALVVLRGVCLWVSVGEPVAEPVHEHGADCGHDHGHDCGHDHHDHHDHGVLTSLPLATPTPAHADHGHSHAHGHSHGGGDDGHGHAWAPWRFVVLLLPVALFFFDLPNKAMVQAKDVSAGFSAEGLTVGDTTDVDTKVSFLTLEQAALTEEGRALYSDKAVRLEGIFAGNDENRFTLTRPTMNCCAADAITLKAVILVSYKKIDQDASAVRLDPSGLNNKSTWVRVTGVVKFLQPTGGGPYTTTLIVTPTKDDSIKKLVEKMAKPPANQYVY